MDGDHGLAETFLKIRSGLYRKVNFYGRFFLLSILQPEEVQVSDFFGF